MILHARKLTVEAPVHRVMSLNDPMSKMSKSNKSDKSRILITDTPDQIKSKINAAVTDSLPGLSYDADKRPGISNLIDILSIFDAQGRGSAQLSEHYSDLSPRQLKEMVTDAVIQGLNGIRERYAKLLDAGENYLDEVAVEGARKARESAEETMNLVREAVGL